MVLVYLRSQFPVRLVLMYLEFTPDVGTVLVCQPSTNQSGLPGPVVHGGLLLGVGTGVGVD
jgi:hypothetical protein